MIRARKLLNSWQKKQDIINLSQDMLGATIRRCIRNASVFPQKGKGGLIKLLDGVETVTFVWSLGVKVT